MPYEKHKKHTYIRKTNKHKNETLKHFYLSADIIHTHCTEQHQSPHYHHTLPGLTYVSLNGNGKH